MKKVFISCPPMLGEKAQISELASQTGLDLVCGDVLQTLSEEQLLETLPQFDGWIAGDDVANRKVLTRASEGKLRAIVKWGIGVDNIDGEAVGDLGIRFANTPGMFSHEVADLAMAYLVGLTRKIGLVDRAVRQGDWIKPQGVSLFGKTAGVVGLGNIGRQIIKRLNVAGVKTLGYDPVVESHEVAEMCTWPDRLSECDFLLFSCALVADNWHMLNEDTIDLAKPGCYVVNVSRGPLIDQGALEQALLSGRVGGAALDVFEVEPLPEESPLTTMQNVILGAHNASNTREAVQATNIKAVRLIAEMLVN